MTKRRSRNNQDALSTPTPMEQFLYLLLEMENLLSRQSIRWKPGEAATICRRLGKVVTTVAESSLEQEE
jgi:hypothetical protein